jgi:ATP-dependent DNA helicase 2 subunit 2
MNMSKTNVIIANETDEMAKLALPSLVSALHELEWYAVARFVRRNGVDPVLLLLAPSIEPDCDCLLDVELPFAEDLRQCTFPPLDKVVTVAGKHITRHRNLPGDRLMGAMSQYVDAMDLSSFAKDDEGNPKEYASIRETYSPILHRVSQVVRHRAVHPTAPAPPPYRILVEYSQPPEELVKASEPALAAVIKAAGVKKILKKI